MNAIESLQSRVDELEGRLSPGRKSKPDAETRQLREDTVNDTADEANRLLQALAHAFVDQLRSAADVVKTVADEAFQRTKAHTSKTDRDDRASLSDIANDISGVVNKGVGKSLEAPGRVVDKFHEVYHRRVRT